MITSTEIARELNVDPSMVFRAAEDLRVVLELTSPRGRDEFGAYIYTVHDDDQERLVAKVREMIAPPRPAGPVPTPTPARYREGHTAKDRRDAASAFPQED